MIFSQPASSETLNKTINALKLNGIEAMTVASGAEAKKKVLEMIPTGAEVMNMSSVTISSLGIADEINTSGKYNSVKAKLKTMDRSTKGLEMQKIGAAPEWAVGSVHAVTEDGKVIIASNTGSQLPSYAYASAHVIWVVGTQKIVPNLETGLQRINEYILPLESDRLGKAYGNPQLKSNVSKLLIVQKEIVPNRITLIFVPEVIGF